MDLRSSIHGNLKMVKNALENTNRSEMHCMIGEEDGKTSLKKLAELRNKADYHPDTKLTSKDLTQAINHMEKIFNNLKFD